MDTKIEGINTFLKIKIKEAKFNKKLFQPQYRLDFLRK